MTLQEQLEKAVSQVETDSQILHGIVHGDDESIIHTEGGPVRSPAKVIKDIEEYIRANIQNLDQQREEFEAVLKVIEEYCTTAENSVSAAVSLIASLSIPADLRGQAGTILAVKEDESGYELIRSENCFYGLRLEGTRLLFEYGEGKFQVDGFLAWFIATPGLLFKMNDNNLVIEV